MDQIIIDIGKQALVEYGDNDPFSITEYVEDRLDKKFGRNWNCVVRRNGSNYGGNIWYDHNW